MIYNAINEFHGNVCLKIDYCRRCSSSFSHNLIFFCKAESMFCFSSVKIWNALPKSVRECDKLNVFKSQLKSHYFNVAFDEVPDL